MRMCKKPGRNQVFDSTPPQKAVVVERCVQFEVNEAYDLNTHAKARPPGQANDCALCGRADARMARFK